MDDLAKQVNDLCTTFFKEEYRNRLSQFSFGSFRKILIKMIQDYKVKNGKNKAE